MANPRKKKKKARRAAPKRPAKRAAPRKSKLEKSLDRARAEGRRLREKIADMKHRRRNPKRPPGRWFDRCLASVEARGYASDPAAVCGAAWWRMPEHRRAAIVRRLERKGGRHRRAAYAIARAEQRRADRHRRGKKKTLR